jgi:hypothetical protein
MEEYFTWNNALKEKKLDTVLDKTSLFSIYS